MDLDLKGKVAVVTGASRGIGRATALAFAEQGANLAICARGQDGLDAILMDFRARGVQAFGQVAEDGFREERFGPSVGRPLELFLTGRHVLDQVFHPEHGVLAVAHRLVVHSMKSIRGHLARCVAESVHVG